MDEIKKINPRFTVWMRPRAIRATGPLMRRLRPYFKRELERLDRAGLTEPTDLLFEDTAGTGTERLEFTVYPGGEGEMALRGITFGVRSTAPHKALRASLESKAGKYGRELVEPYVIVNWAMPMMVDDHFTKLALFDERDGFFTQIRHGRRVNSNVSAVAYYYSLLTEDGAEFILRIFHNPFAERPLSRDLFDGYPQCEASRQPDDTFSYTWSNPDPRLET